VDGWLWPEEGIVKADRGVDVMLMVYSEPGGCVLRLSRLVSVILQLAALRLGFL